MRKQNFMKKLTAKKSVVFILGAALCAMSCAVGCSSVKLVRPQFDSVKKIAIAGMTANYEIYDVGSPKKEEEGMRALGKLIGTTLSRSNENLENAEHLQIVTYALKSFGESMNGINGWELMDPASVISNSAYQELQQGTTGSGIVDALAKGAKKLVESEWVAPPGMQAIPVSSVVEPQGQFTVSNQEKPEAKVRKKLASLCTSLGLDAIAVVQMDLAYKKGKLSGMSGTGLLSFVRGKSTPSVSACVVVVDKNGEVVLRTSDISRGGGDRYESKSVPMMLKGKVDLKDKDGKSVHGYNVAIDKCSASLKSKILKQISKSSAKK